MVHLQEQLRYLAGPQETGDALDYAVELKDFMSFVSGGSRGESDRGLATAETGDQITTGNSERVKADGDTKLGGLQSTGDNSKKTTSVIKAAVAAAMSGNSDENQAESESESEEEEESEEESEEEEEMMAVIISARGLRALPEITLSELDCYNIRERLQTVSPKSPLAHFSLPSLQDLLTVGQRFDSQVRREIFNELDDVWLAGLRAVPETGRVFMGEGMDVDEVVGIEDLITEEEEGTVVGREGRGAIIADDSFARGPQERRNIMHMDYTSQEEEGFGNNGERECDVAQNQDDDYHGGSSSSSGNDVIEDEGGGFRLEWSDDDEIEFELALLSPPVVDRINDVTATATLTDTSTTAATDTATVASAKVVVGDHTSSDTSTLSSHASATTTPTPTPTTATSTAPSTATATAHAREILSINQPEAGSSVNADSQSASSLREAVLELQSAAMDVVDRKLTPETDHEPSSSDTTFSTTSDTASATTSASNSVSFSIPADTSAPSSTSTSTSSASTEELRDPAYEQRERMRQTLNRLVSGGMVSEISEGIKQGKKWDRDRSGSDISSGGSGRGFGRKAGTSSEVNVFSDEDNSDFDFNSFVSDSDSDSDDDNFEGYSDRFSTNDSDSDDNGDVNYDSDSDDDSDSEEWGTVSERESGIGGAGRGGAVGGAVGAGTGPTPEQRRRMRNILASLASELADTSFIDDIIGWSDKD
jgi:hypothetical protein